MLLHSRAFLVFFGTISSCFILRGKVSATTRACAFVPVARTSQKGGSMSHQRQDLFRLHLFAFNLFGDKSEDKEESIDNDDDDDTLQPSWVDSIKQWPLYPTQPQATRGQILTPPTTLEEEKEALRQVSASSDGDDRSNLFSLGLKIPVPLTNLVNVEALLMASSLGGKMTEEKERTMMSDNWTSILLDWSTKNNSLTTVDDSLMDDSRADGTGPWSILPDMEELSGWSRWIQRLQRSLTILPLDAASKITTTSSSNTSRVIVADSILKEASNRIEDLVTEIAAALSPSTIQDLILRASQTLEKTRAIYPDTSSLPPPTTGNTTTTAKDIIGAAIGLAREQGVDVLDAAKLARETTKFASNLVDLANKVLTSGFAVEHDDDTTTPMVEIKSKQLATASFATNTLFADFDSARVLSARYEAQMRKAAEMGALAGAIYQETVPRTHALGHSIVANGTTADVVWMVTDSITSEQAFRETARIDQDIELQQRQQLQQVFVRTVTVRGFDASDESVDRERLLNAICTATPERISDHVLAHSGLMSVARQIYEDIKQYIAWTAPNHRIVLNGHSVGGSIAILLLFLLTEEFGAEFVREKVLRVFTFGSPPVTTTTYKHVKNPTLKNTDYLDLIERGGAYQCDVLKEFNLPPFLVYGFAQPWDPIVRLFSPFDALYPLLGDLGEDGVTLYASGPPRSLRPILRAVVESWEGWPFFRDNFRSSASQNYTSVGVQHILLPEALRYLSDRVVGANVGVPPVEAVLRISSTELLPGLQQVFPLDVFQISFIPAAIRGFIHHFYPAYGDPFVEFVLKLTKPIRDTNITDPSIDVVGATAATKDAVQELPSSDDRILVRNGVNQKSRTELGLGWRGKWKSSSKRQ